MSINPCAIVIGSGWDQSPSCFCGRPLLPEREIDGQEILLAAVRTNIPGNFTGRIEVVKDLRVDVADSIQSKGCEKIAVHNWPVP